MSSFRYDSLPSWNAEGDRARPISSTPEYDANVKATWCGLDEEGDVAYGPDIPLVVMRGKPMEIGGKCFYANVAEPKDPGMNAILQGKELVMATWPVSRGWYDRGTFLPGSKHKAKPLGEDLEQAFRQNPRVLRDLLQELQRNPLDSRHDTVTAMLFDPFHFDSLKKFILGRQCHFKHFKTTDVDGKGKI